MKLRIAFVVILLLWLSTFLAGQPSSGSSFSPRPSGALGFYRALEWAHLSPERFRQPFSDLPSYGPAVLFLIAPTSMGNAAALARWIEAGNTLLLFEGGSSEAVLTALGVSARKVAISFENVLRSRNDPVPVLEQPPLSPVLDGVSTITYPGVLLHGIPTEAQILVGGEKEPSVVTFPFGKGTVWLFPEPAPIENSRIDRSDNLRLFYQLAASHGRILFDEFHHGYRLPAPAAVTQRIHHLILFFILLAAGLTAAAVSSAVRFGPPIPQRDRRQPPSTDFVLALGLLYADHRAFSVLRDYAASWKRRLLEQVRTADTASLVRLGHLPAESAERFDRARHALDTASDGAKGPPVTDTDIQLLENTLPRHNP